MFSFGFISWDDSCGKKCCGKEHFYLFVQDLLAAPLCSYLCRLSPAPFSFPRLQTKGSRCYPCCTLPHPCRHTCLCTQAPLLMSPPTEGALELHTHHLIPSLRQVVFQGDRLPFQCSASYLGNDTRIRWYHNQTPVEGDEQAGILLAESLIHDCTFITRYKPCCPFSVRAVGESGQGTYCPPSKGAMPRHIPESTSFV